MSVYYINRLEEKIKRLAEKYNSLFRRFRDNLDLENLAKKHPYSLQGEQLSSEFYDAIGMGDGAEPKRFRRIDSKKFLIFAESYKKSNETIKEEKIKTKKAQESKKIRNINMKKRKLEMEIKAKERQLKKLKQK